MTFTTAPPCVCVTTLADSARRPFDGNRLAALLGQWPRDAETALQAVSADLGIDIKPGRSEEELAAEDAAATAEAIAANPGRPPLRFAIGDRVECNVGEWASGKVIALWYSEPGFDQPAPYQVLLDSGSFIFAPQDVDSVVRVATGTAAAAPQHPFRGVLRSKGWCWLNAAPTQAGFWSHAGRSVEIVQAGQWWVTKSDGEMRTELGSGKRYDEAKAAVAANPNLFGDCRQDLVFIGVGMDEEAIRQALDGCLLTTADEFAAFRQAWDAARQAAPA